MTTGHHPAADQAVRVLGWGFRIAAAAILLGSIISLARQQPLSKELPGIGHVIDDVVGFEGTGFFGIGIFAIILTPVVATLMIAIAYARAGDRRYAMWSGAVLAILAVSVLWSQR
jgi:uncharacterized membrane protein